MGGIKYHKISMIKLIIKLIIKIMKRIIKFTLRGELEIEMEDIISVPVPPIVEPPIVIPPTEPTNKIINIPNWAEFVENKTSIELLDGYTYVCLTYTRVNISQNLEIFCNGKATLIFGKDYYNQWRETGEDQVIFYLGRWNNKITIRNIDIFTGKLIDQVEPFYRTLFLNAPEENQTGTIELINSNTNLEYGLLYSGSQYEYLTAKSINVNFEGVMYQELKAKHGGGLLCYQRKCNLKQIKPITHFEADLSFEKNKVTSSVSFDKIQNKFHGWGNSANILFLDNMTFYLPGNGNLGMSHTIRSIPQVGEVYSLQCVGGMLRGNTVNLQAGDIIRHNDIDYTVTSTDRIRGDAFYESGYSIDYYVNYPIPAPEGSTVQVSIVKSRSAALLDGIPRKGYMIFKYNKHFQTNLYVDHGLDYMLASVPFGVLSYNHGQCTFDLEDVNHDGFYRQSDGAGFSNGYRMVRCTGFEDQFNPPVTVITE